MSTGPARVIQAGPIISNKLLVGLLARFRNLSGAAGGFRLGFLLGCVALRLALVLLGLAFAGQVIAAGECPRRLFDLALHVFDDALDSFSRSRFVVSHGLTPLRWRACSGD